MPVSGQGQTDGWNHNSEGRDVVLNAGRRMTHHVHKLRYFQSKIHFDDVAGIQHRANPFLITLEQVSEEGVFTFSY